MHCMHDPVTALATTRFEDPGIPNLAGGKTADYWRRWCESLRSFLRRRSMTR